MAHLFIHAPPTDGTQGIILLHTEKNGSFREKDIENLCQQLLYRHDPRDFIIHANRNVTNRMVAEYQLRREKNMMQRYSLLETFEDLHADEWLKIFQQHYSELALFVNFIRESQEEKVCCLKLVNGEGGKE